MKQGRDDGSDGTSDGGQHEFLAATRRTEDGLASDGGAERRRLLTANSCHLQKSEHVYHKNGTSGGGEESRSWRSS